MINDLQRLLGKLRRPAPRPARPIDLQHLRSALLDSVKDCHSGLPTQRLHARIARATSAQDLWVLRADIHDVISRHHCQTIAVERIRHLELLREG